MLFSSLCRVTSRKKNFLSLHASVNLLLKKSTFPLLTQKKLERSQFTVVWYGEGQVLSEGGAGSLCASMYNLWLGSVLTTSVLSLVPFAGPPFSQTVPPGAGSPCLSLDLTPIPAPSGHFLVSPGQQICLLWCCGYWACMKGDSLSLEPHMWDWADCLICPCCELMWLST